MSLGKPNRRLKITIPSADYELLDDANFKASIMRQFPSIKTDGDYNAAKAVGFTNLFVSLFFSSPADNAYSLTIDGQDFPYADGQSLEGAAGFGDFIRGKITSFKIEKAGTIVLTWNGLLRPEEEINR